MEQSNEIIYFVSYWVVFFKHLWWPIFPFEQKIHNRNCWCGWCGGYRGRGGSFGSVSLSLSLFCLWIGPHWPLADSGEAIYSAGNLNEPKKGQFHGNWVWNRQRIKKKKQGRLFQCSRAAGGLFNGCLTVARTHLLTMPCTTHTHINTNTAMHWCIDSNMHKLWTLDSPRHASSHICTHIHTHAVVFDFGSVAWGFKILDYGTVPELCNLLSSHS